MIEEKTTHGSNSSFEYMVSDRVYNGREELWEVVEADSWENMSSYNHKKQRETDTTGSGARWKTLTLTLCEVLPPARLHIKFCNFPKWCHQIGIKFSNMWTYGGYFSFKPQINQIRGKILEVRKQKRGELRKPSKELQKWSGWGGGTQVLVRKHESELEMSVGWRKSN